VARRTNEIGIRLALGAQTRTLLWLIFRESLLLLAAGIVVGVPIAVITARSLAVFLKGQLFQVNAVDPMAFVMAGAIITAITLLAAWLPARRATRVDPITALRCD
jgi:ABC-type antimicrobial peptide transport system permease subunit